MNAYQKSVAEVEQILVTNTTDGLSNEEVVRRLERYGFNQLPSKEEPSLWKIFFKQFINPLMFILILAAIASLFLQEIRDAIVIGFAAIINVIVGFIQEFKAESAAAALRRYEVQFCKVKREGKIVTVDAKGLVPGDVVVLSVGDKVPADIRLFQTCELAMHEAILTGESSQVLKDVEIIHKKTPISDRSNMVFAGTFVLSGKGQGYVVGTGSKTFLGHIADMVAQTKESETPLQLQIGRISWFLATLMISISTVLLLLGVLYGIAISKIVSIAVALAVASVPEGLIVTVTAILAIGMQRMLKRKVLVKNLVAAETLGSVSVVCTDKTGTITEGEMLVSQIVTKNDSLKIDYSSDVGGIISPEIKNILISSILNNDAQYQSDEAIFHGNPVDVALLRVGMKFSLDVHDVRDRFIRIKELPFSPERKYMVTVNKFSDKNIKLILKGAPERIFEFCKNDPDLAFYESRLHEMTLHGLRIIAIAERVIEDVDIEKNMQDLKIIALLGIKDPLRPRVKETIQELRDSGIKLVLITGDHRNTSYDIAREAGLDIKAERIITGMQLEDMSDEELMDRIENVDIFARVEPKHKIRIVEAFKNLGQSVAMVGDGVNDAPALKAADIGVALGSGSDVACEVADMVLIDNNLSSISAAVREGRVIFDNIQRILIFLVSYSFSAVTMIFGSILFNLPLPLFAIQILWINLIQHGFMHIALIFEPGDLEIMKRPPHSKFEPILNKEIKFFIFTLGIITDLGLFSVYVALLKLGHPIDHIRTIIFTALAYDSLFYVFSVKNFRRSLFEINIFDNIWLLWAVGFGFFMQLAVLYFPPLQNLFQVSHILPFEWIIILLMSMLKLVCIEFAKKKLFGKR